MTKKLNLKHYYNNGNNNHNNNKWQVEKITILF